MVTHAVDMSCMTATLWEQIDTLCAFRLKGGGDRLAMWLAKTREQGYSAARNY